MMALRLRVLVLTAAGLAGAAGMRRKPNAELETGLQNNQEARATTAGTMTLDNTRRTSMPPTHLFDGHALLGAKETIRNKSDGSMTATYKSLYWQVQALYEGPVYSIMDRNLDVTIPGASAHDYISIGIYNHPCNNIPSNCKDYSGNPVTSVAGCNSSTGLPWVACDGQRNNDAIAKGDWDVKKAMVKAVRQLTTAMFISDGNEPAYTRYNGMPPKYAEKAAKLLRTFFVDTATRMSPNFYFGQIKPGYNAPKGYGAFIEWTDIGGLLDAVILLEFYDDSARIWTSVDRQAFKQWVSDLYTYIIGDVGKKQGERTNNHGSWYDAIKEAVGLFAKRSSGTAALQAAFEARVDAQIEADGSQPHEARGDKTSDYMCYNLEALIEVAALAKGQGLSLWQNEKLNAAIELLANYISGETPWTLSSKSYWYPCVRPMRYAAVALGNRKYEVAVCEALKSANKPYPGKDSFNLLAPRVHEVTSSCQ